MLRGRMVVGILVAAGKSSRMGFDKLFHSLGGVEVVRLSLQKLDKHPDIDRLVVVAGDNYAQVCALLEHHPPNKPLIITRGGSTRTASVGAGVAACPEASLIAIHDAARPFVSFEVITRTIAMAGRMGAAAPFIPVKDTIKQLDDSYVMATVPRNLLGAVQTPQVFDRAAFAQALAQINPSEYVSITDDCMVMERAGHPVRLVPGEEANYKITTVDDLPTRKEETRLEMLRIGHGYDVHAFAQKRALILGGVEIPFEKGLMGHSDADVLLHAVADALLGGAALGDIGRHFPDTNHAFEGANSLFLLVKTVAIVAAQGWRASNIDATVLCQEPKLAPYIPAMRKNIAKALGVEIKQVSVKATTEEGLGFTGKGEGVAAHCVALLVSKQSA